MRFTFYRASAGLISEQPIWIFIDRTGYLYTDESFFRLVSLLLTEWRNERHMVG